MPGATQPTLYLHGDEDGCVPGLGGREPLAAAELARELIVGAGHFLQYEQPTLVNQLIVDFVTG